MIIVYINHNLIAIWHNEYVLAKKANFWWYPTNGKSSSRDYVRDFSTFIHQKRSCVNHTILDKSIMIITLWPGAFLNTFFISTSSGHNIFGLPWRKNNDTYLFSNIPFLDGLLAGFTGDRVVEIHLVCGSLRHASVYVTLINHFLSSWTWPFFQPYNFFSLWRSFCIYLPFTEV